MKVAEPPSILTLTPQEQFQGFIECEIRSYVCAQMSQGSSLEELGEELEEEK